MVRFIVRLQKQIAAESLIRRLVVGLENLNINSRRYLLFLYTCWCL